MKKSMQTIAVVIVILSIGFVPDAFPVKPVTEKTPPGHVCDFSKCRFKGAVKFSAELADDEVGSDCYILDSLHFLMPDKDYEYLDSITFGPASTFKY